LRVGGRTSISAPDPGATIGPDVGEDESIELSEVVESVKGLNVAVDVPVFVVVVAAGAGAAVAGSRTTAIATLLTPSAPIAQSASQRFPRVDLVIGSPRLQLPSIF
jgi:hypothetical protein